VPLPETTSYFETSTTTVLKAPELQCVQFMDKDGKSLEGHTIRFQLVCVYAPERSTQLSLLAGTWNVGNARPEGDLASWLDPHKDTFKPDLIMVGLQESTFESPDCEKEMIAQIRAAIESLEDAYVLVCAQSLGQMRAMVWARLWVRAGIGSCESSSEATGVGHVMSNKGGIAIALEVWDTTIVFVSAHLAAHQDQTHRRNEDYREIVLGLNPGSGTYGDILTRFDHCVWVGDLNYRLDLSSKFGPDASSKAAASKVHDHVVEICSKGQYFDLMEFDQLKMAIKSGEAFPLFTEGPIFHEPTFKVKKGVKGTQYNSERVPAYCDRILWRSVAGLGGAVSMVWSAPEVFSSDHKPVAARLYLECRSPRPSWWPRLEERERRGSDSVPQVQDLSQTGMKYVPLTWSVEFIALEGKNLRAADASGTSDPYVIFSGAPCVCEAVGEPVLKTLNPVWPRQKLPSIHVCADSPQSLEQDHILISIMDRDTVTADDLLGSSVLSFRSLHFASGVDPFRGAWPQDRAQAQASFDLPVLYAGIRQGSLSGTVSITPTSPLPLDEFFRGKTLSGKSVAGLGSVLLRALTVSP